MLRKSLILPLVVALSFGSTVFAQEEKKVTFEDHIKPIFREHCTACHSESDKESDLALDTYGATLAGGSGGEIIAEGRPGGSRLWALITHAERPFMPPDQDPIPEAQRNLIKTWIEQGMPENSGSKIKRTNNAAAAMLTNTSLGKPDGPPPMPQSLLRQPVTETRRSAAISALAASPWAPLLAVGGQEQVVLYHSQSGELLGVIPFPEGEPQSLSFTRDGKQLLIGGGRHSHSGCAVLVDVATGSRITKVGDELDTVLAADVSPDKSRIAIAGPQKVVRVFDSVSGDLVFEMKKHTDWIFALRYSPDGVLLASGDRSNGLVVWEADTGRLYSELVGHKGEVRSLDFRGDSNVLASGSLDGTIKFWDMFESKEIKSWGAHGGGVTAVAFAHSGLVASAGRDARVKLWNGNGELQKEFQGLSEAALEVALTGDAAHVAGGDWNGKVQLWQAADPKQTKLIVANPVSIEKRLADASAELASVQAEFDSAKLAADTALALAGDSQNQSTAAQKSADELSSQLTEATQSRESMTGQLSSQDQEIKKLEEQLATARAQREQVAKQLQQTQARVTDLSQKADGAQKAAVAAQAKQQELAQAAEQATQKQQEIQTRLTAAQAVAKKAAEDKAALDAKAASLKQLAQQTATQVNALADQVSAALTEQQTQQVGLEKLTIEMNALTEQLALLQKRVEKATATQTQAQQQLSEKQAKTDELKSQLDAAEQAALDAQEQLELFQRSYQRPD